MEIWRENFSMISRLRVAEDQTDALAARLFFERLFTAANFHPSGLSQRAIVCIKKLAAPPVNYNRQRFNGSNLAVEWESGIRDEVENLARRAYHPIRESVPAQAASIIFEDRAEMLACLALDWRRGILTERWWWRALFPNLFRSQTPFKIWLAAAEFTPFALEILSKNGEAERFVKKLEPLEVSGLLHEIIQIFSLSKLQSALFEPLEKKSSPTVTETVKTAEKKQFQAGEDLAVPAAAEALFASILDRLITADLSFEQTLLLETAVLLARSPRMARSMEFAARAKIKRVENEFRKSVAAEESVKLFEETKVLKRGVTGRKKSSRRFEEKAEIQIDRAEPAKTEPPFRVRRKAGETEKPVEKTSVEPKKSTGTGGATANLPKKSAKFIKPEKFEFEDAPPEKKLERIEQRKRPEIFGKPAAPNQIFESFFENAGKEYEYVFQTRFGGLFYLLNLGLYLGLYRDFTEAPTTEIDLDIWDFVALLGLEFLGGQIKTDAVWDFLKLAAGRENDDEFGREFNQFQDWRMPPSWLETFPANREWFWAKKRQRLVVRHADGFNVIDISRRGAAEAQLKNELENYPHNFSRCLKAEKKNLRQFESQSWLKNLAEYLRKRLFQALKLQTPEDLNAVFFEHQATVAVSATHLEITFGLADLPVEIRLAGIDRNPAWIPAAGKYVYFHYV